MTCLAVPYIIFWYHHPLQTNTTVLGYTTCMAMFQNIARLKTSKAIKILYQEFTRYLFLSTHKAPPLSPHTRKTILITVCRGL